MPISFLVLFAAVLAAWLPQPADAPLRRLTAWQVLLLAAVGLALWQGFIAPVGLLPLVGLFAAALAARRAADANGSGAGLLLWITAFLAVALATHRLPGFSPFLVSEMQAISPGSVPMSVRAHIDKGVAGLILLAWFTRRASNLRAFASALGTGFAVGLATAAVVVAVVVAGGAVRWEPKLPVIAWQWMFVNLFLTSVMEEALFRGLIQHRLTIWFEQRSWSGWWALAAASLLFGLAHAGGGLLLCLAATAAGVGYGLAYRMTGRIEASLTAHFILNSVHFFGFTYPYALG